jgi:cobalt-precorrin-5B (C1)-methyltransferase
MAEVQKKLRSGYTTGACATAATKGALLALIHQRRFGKARIRLPIGQYVTFLLHSCVYTHDEGRSSVIKDAGDDPDVTHGAEICARVWWSEQPGVQFHRGVGVGLVTKKGLPVPPGEPAINPVPRQMIRETVQQVLRNAQLAEQGVVVEISVPNGEELAQKTFNPRLGIIGGISILGTTGIVEPYSLSAWLASVLQAIDVAVAQDCTHLVFTVGARGERFAQRLFTLPAVAFIQIGGFFGDALQHAAKAGVQKVTMAVMIGKLAKFAAGNPSVHSKASSQDFLFLSKLAQEAGAGKELIAHITSANTAREVSELIVQSGVNVFYDLLCYRAWEYAHSLTQGAYALEILLLGDQGEIWGRYLPLMGG